METIKVDERQPGLSSKELREARTRNLIPAAIYGKGVPSQSIFLKTPGATAKELKIGKHFKLKVGSNTYQASVDEVQRDPISQAPLHVSLHAVSPDHVMKADVRIIIDGEAKGHKSGGVVTQTKSTLSLKGKFSDLPEEIILDTTGLEVNSHFEAKDIELPKGVELLEDPGTSIVVCAYSNVSMEAEPEEGETEETATKASAENEAAAEPAEKPAPEATT